LLKHVFVNRSGFGVLALDGIKDGEIVECIQGLRMGGPVDAALGIDDGGIEFFRVLIAVFALVEHSQVVHCADGEGMLVAEYAPLDGDHVLQEAFCVGNFAA
jgi:hypothetical protein